jgi:uncharacterized membrane protein
MMKSIIITIFYYVGSLSLYGVDEPLIPASLNAVLPKIHARMTVREVEAVLAPAYPKLEIRSGPWSGGTGYIAFKLDERYTISISAITREGKDVVHDEVCISLDDWKAKRGLSFSFNEWGKQTDQQPALKLEEPIKTGPGKPQ